MSSTVVSWALTLFLVGIGVYYYKPDLVQSLFGSSAPAPSSYTEPAERPAVKKAKPKKTRVSKVAGLNNDSTESTANEAGPNKKRKIVAADDSIAAVATGSNNEGKDDDREFAQQLAKTQAGTNLQKSEGQKSKKKNKNKNNANQQPQALIAETSGVSTETSSTTGRDADDDLTPADSPMAQPANGPSKAGDISDMLEAPTAKPQTLRLTNIPDEKPKKKAAQPFEQVLTKKQRQAQAKKEEMRQMKEESDRLHEAKKQEQLRKARMASGTSNQTRANNFASTTGNAWQSGKGSAAVKAPASDSAAPLLDTFEPSSNNVSQPHGAVHTESLTATKAQDVTELKEEVGAAKASTLGASSREGAQSNLVELSSNLSEKEQMNIMTGEEAWQEVPNKKSKKKNNKIGSDAGSEIVETKPQPKPGVVGVTPVQQSNGPQKTASQAPAKIPAKTNNPYSHIQSFETDDLKNAEWEA